MDVIPTVLVISALCCVVIIFVDVRFERQERKRQAKDAVKRMKTFEEQVQKWPYFDR